jgi:S-adenosylmethionine synthetase
MFEKVNPSHPDKIADRIAGALVDLAYANQENPKVAIEVLIGHGKCTIIAESSFVYESKNVLPIVQRIGGDSITELEIKWVPQDEHLAHNQDVEIRCGDNGIFKGEPLNDEEMVLSEIAQKIYEVYPTDGKYILDEKTQTLIVCQSCCDSKELKEWLEFEYPEYKIIVNPLGDWTGGSDVDTGAVNRKLGSDMGRAVTGGGLTGKDLSKADVSVNIYAFLEAQRTGKSQQFFCAIGDTEVNGIPYSKIVQEAKEDIDSIGGFESLAMWGLI